MGAGREKASAGDRNEAFLGSLTRTARAPEPVDEDVVVGFGGPGAVGGEGATILPVPRTRRRKARKKTGKRSNPDWELVSHYMRKSTYREVKRALLDQETKMDLSDLIEGLCREWLEDVGGADEGETG